MKGEIGLSDDRIRDIVELAKASVKLTPRQRFEVLAEAHKVAMLGPRRRSVAEIGSLLRKVRKKAREI